MDYSAYPAGKNEMFDKDNSDKDDLDELVIDSDYSDDDDIMGGVKINVDRKKRSLAHSPMDTSERNGFISSAEAFEKIVEDPNSGV
ncbi:hypothetical protein LOTGIDRAFT_239351 [Lottia gigantea]|uniref:Uncharacterized protein n=1 Tax=Lottia gigantea TaxID=225164 RepID=V3ZXM3_LOTGI|nr:hypothetical protein LOTGIDRAFT_239351 [Lottia gigantea]ESO96298.1 hypothetical protein LOTGIDRAFT_239351 [Lottia gigantea]